MLSALNWIVASVLAAAPAAAVPAAGPTPGRLVEKVGCLSDETETYAVYLPAAYDRMKRWPALLVLDPRGRAFEAAELFRQAAETYGWIVLSSYGTRSDESWEPNERAINALWPEVRARYAVDPSRIYAAGFSGTCMAAWQLAKQTGEIAGVIAAGGRFDPQAFDPARPVAVFGFTGDTDFNNLPMRRLDAHLQSLGFPHRIEPFEGPHSWMPAAMAPDAVAWMEVQAIRAGKRPKDDAWIRARLDADLSAARSLEATGNPLEALRRYRAVVSTFDGLTDVTAAKEAAARLAATPDVVAAEQRQARADAFEQEAVDRAMAAFLTLRDRSTSRYVADLSAATGVPDLKRLSTARTSEGMAAKRVLQAIFAEASFYVPRRFFDMKEYTTAATSLGLAVELRPDAWWAWLDLARAWALAGKRGKALDALERAVAGGLTDAATVEGEPAFAPLRRDKRYTALVHRLGVRS